MFHRADGERTIVAQGVALALLEGVGMLVFGLLAEHVRDAHRPLVVVAVLCFTMGLQNALITRIGAWPIRTTHVTGMVTDIGIELGKLTYVERTPGLDPVAGSPRKLGMLALLVGLFFLGGVVGAACYDALGFTTLVPPALVLLAVALPSGASGNDLVPAALRLLDSPAPRGLRPEAVRDFLRHRQRLSAVALCSFSADGEVMTLRLWTNPQAKHPLPPDIARFLVRVAP